MKTKIKSFIVILAVVLSVLAVAGCNKTDNNPVVGSYMGSLGSSLKINSDGTCDYYDAAWLKTERGTWKIENDILTLYDVSRSGELTADISEFTNNFDFILRGNGSEKFTKKTTVK